MYRWSAIVNYHTTFKTLDDEHSAPSNIVPEGSQNWHFLDVVTHSRHEAVAHAFVAVAVWPPACAGPDNLTGAKDRPALRRASATISRNPHGSRARRR